VASLLGDAKRLVEMGRNARKLGRPAAAASIVADILGLLRGQTKT